MLAEVDNEGHVTIEGEFVGKLEEPELYWSDENANFVQATVINVDEAYFHCPRSFKFANLWDAETIKSNASRSIASLKAT